ncbi:hypothetical protein ACFX13_006884 [Malus domestica]
MSIQGPSRLDLELGWRFLQGPSRLDLEFVWNFFKVRRGLILKVEIGPQGASCALILNWVGGFSGFLQLLIFHSLFLN